MKLWKMLVIGAAAALTLAVGANFVAMAAGSDNPASVVDISGPCDEAEHANDPECAGVTVPGGQRNDTAGRVDISGPCDEAEHANDPECANGGRDAEDEDNSGPGSGDGDHEDNSGPGNAEDREDRDEDNSGPGSGDGDHEDNSGPGNGDD